MIKAEDNITLKSEKGLYDIAADTAQYFWHTQTGTDTGVHITEVPKDEFIEDSANGGSNLLATSNGIAVRDGTTELATFGANAIGIGKNSKTAEIQMCDNGFKVRGAYKTNPMGGNYYAAVLECPVSANRTREVEMKTSSYNSMSLTSYNNDAENDFWVTCSTDSAEASMQVDASGEYGVVRLQADDAYLEVSNGNSGDDGDLAVPNVTVGARLNVPNNRIQNMYAYNNTVTYKPNMYIGTTGLISRTTHENSSKRYKHDIKDVTNKELDPHRLYDIEVKQFKFNDDVVTDEKDPRRGADLIGFIAEQVAECYPVAVDINENGDIESWSAHYIVPPMLALIQEQHKEIEQLKECVKALERTSK